MDFFTSDWHLNDELIREKCGRKFKNAARMNEVFIKQANQRAHASDTIIHVGDFIQRGMDRGTGLERSKQIKTAEALEQIDANVLLLEGNHDENNRCNAAGKCLIRKVGRIDCLVQHFPSTALGFWCPSCFRHTDPHIFIVNVCGHVHRAWKVFIDWQRKVINFNIGIDIFPYMVKEAELADLISRTLAAEGLKFLRLV